MVGRDLARKDLYGLDQLHGLGQLFTLGGQIEKESIQAQEHFSEVRLTDCILWPSSCWCFTMWVIGEAGLSTAPVPCRTSFGHPSCLTRWMKLSAASSASTCSNSIRMRKTSTITRQPASSHMERTKIQTLLRGGAYSLKERVDDICFTLELILEFQELFNKSGETLRGYLEGFEFFDVAKNKSQI